MKTNLMHTPLRVFALLAASWGYAGALLTLFPQPSQDFVAYVYAMPWYSIGLAWAGWHWLRHGRTDKGYAHVLAALFLALPRLYHLPTDLFGPIPIAILSLCVGGYVHLNLWREDAAAPSLRFSGLPLVGWAVVLPLLHALVAQAHAVLKSEWLALR